MRTSLAAVPYDCATRVLIPGTESDQGQTRALAQPPAADGPPSAAASRSTTGSLPLSFEHRQDGLHSSVRARSTHRESVPSLRCKRPFIGEVLAPPRPMR